MSIDPLDRLHDQQPVPGQRQNPSHAPEPEFVTDNPDIPSTPGNAGKPINRPGSPPDAQVPGSAPEEDDPARPGLGNPIP